MTACPLFPEGDCDTCSFCIRVCEGCGVKDGHHDECTYPTEIQPICGAIREEADKL